MVPIIWQRWRGPCAQPLVAQMCGVVFDNTASGAALENALESGKSLTS